MSRAIKGEDSDTVDTAVPETMLRRQCSGDVVQIIGLLGVISATLSLSSLLPSITELKLDFSFFCRRGTSDL